MRVLITGAAGFIGQHVAREFEKLAAKSPDGVQLKLIDLLDHVPSPAGKSFGKLPIYRVDIRDKAEVDLAVREFQPTVIIHAAALASESLSNFAPRQFVETNCIGTANLATAAAALGKTLRRFVNISTAAVYGKTAANSAEFLIKVAPIDVYGSTKATAESIVKNTLPGKSTSIRLRNVYGPGQRLDVLDRGVVAIFIRHAIERRRIPIYGDGMQRRQFTYIGDVARFLAEFATSRRRRSEPAEIDFGSVEGCPIYTLAHTVWGLVNPGEFGQVIKLPRRDEADDVSIAKTQKPNPASIVAKTTLDRGLAATVKWAKWITDRDPDAFGRVKRLPVDLEVKKIPAWLSNLIERISNGE